MRHPQKLNTRFAIDLLQKKLNHLKSQLPEASAQIEKARALGDLSENYEYHAAKKARNDLQREIDVLAQYMTEAKTGHLPITQPTEVYFGSKVMFKKLGPDSNSSSYTYIILGDHESEVSKSNAISSISLYSPIAQSMVGKTVNSIFKFREEKYQILRIDAASEDEVVQSMNKELAWYKSVIYNEQILDNFTHSKS
jgi:transcription elongation factor GreA